MQNNNFYTLIVNKIQTETTDTLSVSFAIPDDLKATFAYTQGQYLTLRFLIRGKEERRAYSMSSSPLEKDLTITVKRVHKGLISNYIADNLKVGSEVEVMPPQGRFFTTLDATQRKTYYLFGAGSGITPLISMIKTMVEIEPQSNIYLLYGARDENSIIFKTQLDNLAARYAGQLKVDYTLSQPKRQKSGGLSGLFSKGTITWQGKIGRIDAKAVTQFLEEHHAFGKTTEYFICGPGNLIEQVQQTLLSKNIDKKQIHSEHFISAPLSVSAPTGSIAADGVKAMVTLQGKTMEVFVPAGKTILEALIAQKINAPYSCTSGACSTCMAKVIKGSAKMDTCYALEDDEVAAGYILTCQARPTSNELEINYDS